jgi:hypothetical protein
MSYREYLTRLAWLEEQWNRPNLTQFYLMQIAMEIRSIFSKRSLRMKDFLIEFVSTAPKPKPTKKEKKGLIASAKSMWRAALGTTGKESKVGITYKTKKRSEIDPELLRHLDGR